MQFWGVDGHDGAAQQMGFPAWQLGLPKVQETLPVAFVHAGSPDAQCGWPFWQVGLPVVSCAVKVLPFQWKMPKRFVMSEANQLCFGKESKAICLQAPSLQP